MTFIWINDLPYLDLNLPLQFLLFVTPANAIKIDAGWWTEESLFVAIGFLRHFGMEHDNHAILGISQIAPHRIRSQSLFTITTIEHHFESNLFCCDFLWCL